MQITPANIDAIYYDFDARFQGGYSAPTPWYDKITTASPSAHREEHYLWMALIPRLKQWLGERVVRNVSARGYVLVNNDYELTLEVDKNVILDDRIGVFAPRIDMMGRQSRLWPNDVVVSVIQGNGLCFDGNAFFYASHPIDTDDATKGTYANDFTTTALTSANYNSVRATMMAYQGEDQKPLGITPNLLIVPPALEAAAKQILNTDFIAPAAAVGQNAASVVQGNVLKGTADILVIPELNNQPTQWYLADTTKPIMPFVWQLRQAPDFVQLTDATSEPVFNRRKFVYGVHARGQAGFSLPFLCARATA